MLKSIKTSVKQKKMFMTKQHQTTSLINSRIANSGPRKLLDPPLYLCCIWENKRHLVIKTQI